MTAPPAAGYGLLTIGEFSKMTHLSVKALRHYHDVGLLEPAAVDPGTGYRRYRASQVSTAQAIRRFRELDMPIDAVRQVLTAPDVGARNRAIVAHLEHLHQQLERTSANVSSLQALLTDGLPATPAVELRRIGAITALTAREVVAFDDCAAWLEPALADLHRRAEAVGAAVAGVDGALYPDAFFADGIGEVTCFVPVAAGTDRAVTLPPSTVAVLRHEGPLSDLDQAYGALGSVVTDRGIGGPGPIREHYLTPASTEVCWPVTKGALP